MKKFFLSTISVVALVCALTFPLSVPAAPPSPKPKPAMPAAAAPQRHPEIHDAIESLRRSREYLNHAAHDFGGHRVDAVRSIDNAIAQLQICLQYDK